MHDQNERRTSPVRRAGDRRRATSAASLSRPGERKPRCGHRSWFSRGLRQRCGLWRCRRGVRRCIALRGHARVVSAVILLLHRALIPRTGHRSVVHRQSTRRPRPPGCAGRRCRPGRTPIAARTACRTSGHPGMARACCRHEAAPAVVPRPARQHSRRVQRPGPGPRMRASGGMKWTLTVLRTGVRRASHPRGCHILDREPQMPAKYARETRGMCRFRTGFRRPNRRPSARPRTGRRCQHAHHPPPQPHAGPGCARDSRCRCRLHFRRRACRASSGCR